MFESFLRKYQNIFWPNVVIRLLVLQRFTRVSVCYRISVLMLRQVLMFISFREIVTTNYLFYDIQKLLFYYLIDLKCQMKAYPFVIKVYLIIESINKFVIKSDVSD